MQTNNPPHPNFPTNTSQRAAFSPEMTNSIKLISIYIQSRLAKAEGIIAI